ncbi:GspE/PulE family protein [Massilia aquatica]|uniref:Type II/IV secretion system protein n=1 Tax=Massilia aquatica TaxID=2609000 RepID=A0ABX0LWF3_9BURK|nr:GspE/PulE family protein [Massilia aquatica]NHZ39178.1 type II/IV secretion system protein [Massilia aquatica]
MNPLEMAPMMESLRAAQRNARQSGRAFFTELEALTGSEPRLLLAQAADVFRLPAIDMAAMLACTPAFERLPLARAQQRQCVLLRAPDGLWAVLCDPYAQDLQVWVETLAAAPVRWRLALPADLQAYLSKQEESVRSVDALVTGEAGEGDSARLMESLSYASLGDAGSPAVKLVNATLYDALKSGVSDIHFESTPGGMLTKYRIDGVLDQAAQVAGGALAEQAISRIKVLAELDIAERRVPQDGSFRVEMQGREIDLRVSIMPSVHGEDAVIRILDKQSMISAHGTLTLDSSGFASDHLATMRRLVSEPYGMVLVTGPTGSGKTTTLYGAITEINSGHEKIITIEDPVEYQLPGILQIPVNDKKGLSFARGLRSILRHDPDIIMVGEIRDKETGEIAVQSALTGHLVLSTVHANNVFDVFGRFAHMGIDPYSFVSALNGVIAQRLVRLSCRQCSAPYTPDDEELVRSSLARAAVSHYNFRRGVGCGECRGTGYKGRRAVAEILILDDALAELVIERRPLRQIKELARAAGMRSLFDDALALVATGETTLEEVRRVTLAG